LEDPNLKWIRIGCGRNLKDGRRSLSLAGRKTLIKVVVQTISSYVIGCFRLPDVVCN